MEQLILGQNYENTEIANIFKCSNQGGIRKSLKTKSIVIIAKYTDCLYTHENSGDIINFMGMGKLGNQEMKRQNKSILVAKDEGFKIHLFEMFEDKIYTYAGVVELIDNPFMKKAPDDKGNERDAIIFPLKRLNNK